MFKKMIMASGMLAFLGFGGLQVMSTPSLPFPEPETMSCMECCAMNYGAAGLESCSAYKDGWGAFCTFRVGSVTWTEPNAVFCGSPE